MTAIFKKPGFRKMGGDKVLEGQRKDGSRIQVEVGLSFFTQQKTANTVLRVSTKLRRASEHGSLIERTQNVAKIGSWFYDAVNDNLTWSRVTYQIHEVDPSQKVTIADGINFYHEDDRPTIQKLADEGIANGSSWQVELRIRTTSGKVKWVSAIGTPIVENGKTDRPRRHLSRYS